MKIAFLDLVHTTCGTHSNTIPLGIGLIATYLKKNISTPLDIRLFKEPEKALAAFKSWTPDILGITQYTWNSELNLYFAKRLKEQNSNILVIAGGPNLEMEKEKRVVFLRSNNYVDICVAYDGEMPILEIVKRFLAGESIEKIKRSPGVGTYCLESTNLSYIEGEGQPPRLENLNAFGPVYAEGLFDEFLEAGYHPFTQTHRGCPFSCAYCRTSDSYNSRMLFQSPEIFKQDMEYLGKRFAGQSEIMLYIANTNMSLFKEDFPIAKIIREMQDRYNWPKYVYFDTGKDPQKLLDMLSIIRFVPAPALQTLTPEVLKNINRRNLPLDDYINFQREVLWRTGENSMSELILCLPGETKLTFLDTLRKVINSGVQSIVVYTLINLPGTPLATREFVEKYQYTLRYRAVPRQYSIIDGKKIIEIEEVIVATKDMSFDDYLEFRGLCLVFTLFLNAVEFIPLKKLLLENNVDIAQWLFNIHENLLNYPDLFSYYSNYLKETKEELFESREELVAFFEKSENFEDFLAGRRGDNLLRKYKFLVFFNNYLSCLEIACVEAKKILADIWPTGDLEVIIKDLYTFLATRDTRPFLEGKFEVGGTYNLHYDIPAWWKNTDKNLTLRNFYGEYAYSVSLDENQSPMLKKVNTHKDQILSLQMLFRDGNTRDLWPKWSIK